MSAEATGDLERVSAVYNNSQAHAPYGNQIWITANESEGFWEVSSLVVSWLAVGSGACDQFLSLSFSQEYNL